MRRRHVVRPVTLGLLAVLIATAIPAVAQDEATEPAAEAKPEVDLSEFPTLKGTLTNMLGHEGGFLRPQPGQPFELNLAQLDEVKKLSFGSGEDQSYIPLPGPLRVETIRRYGNGSFDAMRLISETPKPGYPQRVTLDIRGVAGAGQGPNYCHIWVIIESRGITKGVAVLEGTASGPFPKATD